MCRPVNLAETPWGVFGLIASGNCKKAPYYPKICGSCREPCEFKPIQESKEIETAAELAIK